MKKLIEFRSLILACLFLFPVLMSCDDNDNEIETYSSYSELPAKFEIIETWFAENPTLAPAPAASTRVEIEEGNQFENDHGIGAHYYEIDIDDYFSEGKEYDVEFYLDADIKIIAVVVNDVKVSTSTSDSEYAVAEAKLMEDYKEYTIGDIAWSTLREYQLAKFTITTKADSKSITAWYTVDGATAKREMDSEDLGTILPDKIKAAFEATVYSDAKLWTIKEIELEHNYNNNGLESYYEIELVNKANPKLEAELFFSTTTGELLSSKEEMDDDDDSEDDKFVVNARLKAAVEKAVPGAIIIDAEVEGDIIEVDAIVTVGTITKEIELEFTLAYVLVSSETETEYTYSTLPATFDVVKTWFAENPTIAPAPNATTEVEITEGEQNEIEHTIGDYYYEVEIDDYTIKGKEYELEFYLNKDLAIIAIVVNDVKQ